MGSSLTLCLRVRYQSGHFPLTLEPAIYSAPDIMYPQPGAPMAPPQKPETFMLSTEAQQSLPHDAQVALQQVDNRTFLGSYMHSRIQTAKAIGAMY